MKIKYLPYASLINIPEKGKKQREIIPYMSGDQSMTEKSLCDFFNSKMKLAVLSFFFNFEHIDSSTYRWRIRHHSSNLRHSHHSDYFSSIPTWKGVYDIVTMERKLPTLISDRCVSLSCLHSIRDYPQSHFLYWNKKSQGKYYLFILRKSRW